MNAPYENEVIRSIREFSDAPVSREELFELLAEATNAPNARNRQYYSVIAVSDDKKKRALEKATSGQSFISSAKHILVFCVDHRRISKLLEKAGIEEDIDRGGTFLTSFVDVISLSHRFIELAWKRGIGGVYIGSIQNNMFSLKELLNIGEGVYPVAMLCCGRFDKLPPKKRRLDPSLFVHYEAYDDGLVERFIEASGVGSLAESPSCKTANSSSAIERNKVAARLFKKYIEKEEL